MVATLFAVMQEAENIIEEDDDNMESFSLQSLQCRYIFHLITVPPIEDLGILKGSCSK